MKISQVAVEVVRVPVDRPYIAGGRAVDANWHVLARVTTADGTEGIGYVVYPRPDLMTAIGAAARELGEHLIGMSVLEPEAAWGKLARRGDWVGPGGLLHCALAPLDIAVWDANGKTLGQPLYRLLGGFRDRLPTYASDGLWVSLSPGELAASAKQHVANGFGAVKLRLGKEAAPEMEARRVQAVRDAVGPDVRIMVDAVESWTVAQARRTGRVLQDAGIAWLEDPVHHSDVAGLAQAHRVPFCGHVVPEIQVHLLAAVANGHMVEYVPRSAGILRAMPRIERGELVAPQGSGLGLELDDTAVRRYRVG